MSAFRLSAGACVCGAVPPRVISGFHGDIRLESASGARGSLTGSVRGSLSGIVLGSLSDIVPRIFVGLCTAVVILDCRREGLCTLSFIIINHKLRVTAGRLCLRVCAFAAVCGISSVRGFFIYRRAARISPEMRNFAGIVFCREAHLRTALPSSAEKFFPAVARCRAKVSFRRIFRSDRGGENAFVKAPKNDTFCKFERKFIHFTHFFIDKRRCLPYN